MCMGIDIPHEAVDAIWGKENNIGDAGVEHITQALEKNTKIVEVNLGGKSLAREEHSVAGYVKCACAN